MRLSWLIAGLLFALAVSLAVATAAIRSANVRARQRVERSYRRVEDRIIELRRLGVVRLEAGAPERLAELHRRMLQDELLRREARLQ